MNAESYGEISFLVQTLSFGDDEEYDEEYDDDDDE